MMSHPHPKRALNKAAFVAHLFPLPTPVMHFAVRWQDSYFAFAPNPVECRWVGPLVSDYDCGFCNLGYETTNAIDSTCVKPEFRPYRYGKANTPRS